jgi:catechol 2,3-dioxygenase-like lactoylglutathione lyase family enzyme
MARDRPAARITRLDHVQLAMPAGGEETADGFYRDLLGFEIIPKPEPLAARGGRWYAIGDTQLHLGVEADFHPARKAHPALVVDGIDELAARLAREGIQLRWEDDQPGMRHCYVDDPFGNRIEFIAASPTE